MIGGSMETGRAKVEHVVAYHPRRPYDADELRKHPSYDPITDTIEVTQGVADLIFVAMTAAHMKSISRAVAGMAEASRRTVDAMNRLAPYLTTR